MNYLILLKLALDDGATLVLTNSLEVTVLSSLLSEYVIFSGPLAHEDTLRDHVVFVLDIAYSDSKGRLRSSEVWVGVVSGNAQGLEGTTDPPRTRTPLRVWQRAQGEMFFELMPPERLMRRTDHDQSRGREGPEIQTTVTKKPSLTNKTDRSTAPWDHHWSSRSGSVGYVLPIILTP